MAGMELLPLPIRREHRPVWQTPVVRWHVDISFHLCALGVVGLRGQVSVGCSTWPAGQKTQGWRCVETRNLLAAVRAERRVGAAIECECRHGTMSLCRVMAADIVIQRYMTISEPHDRVTAVTSRQISALRLRPDEQQCTLSQCGKLQHRPSSAGILRRTRRGRRTRSRRRAPSE